MTQEELFEHKARGQEFVLDQNFTITADSINIYDTR